MTELPPPTGSVPSHAQSGTAVSTASITTPTSGSDVTSLPPPVGPPLGARPLAPPTRPHPTLPLAAAIGAIVVLSASLVISKYVLDALVGFEWPVVVYVALLTAIGYGPSVCWCLFVSRRWGTGRLGPDIGLAPRFADLGWGPVLWLGAIGSQLALAAIVVGFGIPMSNNTEGIGELQADRTYVVSLVITAVIAAPVVEEMVFRGVVLRGLRSRLPAIAAIVLQGILFGVAHADPIRGSGNIGLVMVLSGVGIAFGVGTYLLRRIGPAIVAHALFNGAVLVLVLTGVADRLEDATIAVPSPGDGVSAREEFAIVDQAYVTESCGSGDANRPE